MASLSSNVKSRLNRYSAYADLVYVGGQTTGETGQYFVQDTAIDWWYSDMGQNVWVRNVASASRAGGPCIASGDSGGSVFSVVTGGIQAHGTFSGYRLTTCQILFTDIYRSYLGLPGDILLNP